jgi:hypothetical protein
MLRIVGYRKPWPSTQSHKRRNICKLNFNFSLLDQFVRKIYFRLEIYFRKIYFKLEIYFRKIILILEIYYRTKLFCRFALLCVQAVP